MPQLSDRHITIVGAGLAGPLLACFLAREGYQVALYERRGDPRTGAPAEGRSINLALSARGIDALQRIGLADEVLRNVIPMRGRMLHEPDGKLAFQYYSSNHTDAINSVSRGGLNLILVNAAATYPNVKLFFDHRCRSVNLDRNRPTVTFENDVTVETDLIVGADGAFSAVRWAMQIREGFDYSQSYLEHGYKELSIPPTSDGSFAMEPNALHIWPRGGFMMIALPNQDHSFTCTCFWPREMFESLDSPHQIEAHFGRHFPDAVPLMPTLIEDFRRNPVGALVTIRCWPFHFQDKAVLIGDAAHAIVPFYGQGMNCAFEDCVALADNLRSGQPLQAFTQSRKPNTDAIADMALENFVEMRDHVASRAFLLRKRVGHAVHRMFPRAFVPLYDMISFSTIPYAQARQRARWQSRVLRRAAVTLAIFTILATVLVAMLIARG
jgi:kynurenine 3-monooxygenase